MTGAGPGRPSRSVSLIIGRLSYPLYLLGVLAAVVWFCHWRYLVILRKHRAPPPAHAVHQIDSATMRRLGWIHSPPERANAFAHFPERKPPGTVRIGCYGDSFTWGAEVAGGLDYPALLTEALRARGHREIEVLNFGVAGYGMHQTAMLHEATAARWQLDRTMLLARPYWPDRDLTFMAPWGDDRLHARYLVEDGEARLVDVVGDTYEGRLETYLGLIPPLRYWRYDRRPPSALLALVPAGRTLTNPWYHRADPPAEDAVETYRALLRGMATPERPVLLLDAGDAFPALGSGAGHDTRVVAVGMPEGFPHRAARRHLSPWGNRRLAAEVADLLVGPADAPDPVLQVAPLADDPASPGTLAPGGLDELAVTLDDRPIGALFPLGGSEENAVAIDRLPEATGALIALAADRHTPLTDALLVGIERGAAGTVTVTAGTRVRQLEAPRAAGTTLALRRIDLCGPTLRALLDVPDDTPCTLATTRESGSPQAEVAVDGTPVLVASVAGGRRIVLGPVGTGYWIRARGDVAPAIETLPAAGRVWLRGVDASGRVQREALALWTVRR